MNFPENLRSILNSKRASQTELAEAIGVTRASVNSYTLGRRLPSIPAFLKISDFLGVSTDSLLGNENDTGINIASEDFIQYKQTKAYKKLYQGGVYSVLILDADAEAKAVDAIPSDSLPKALDGAYIPSLPPGKYSGLNVVGDSMTPSIHPGELAVCTEISGLDFTNDQIYVVVTRSGLNLKRIRHVENKRDENYGLIALTSDNPRVETWYLEPDDILKLYKVVHVLKIQDL